MFIFNLQLFAKVDNPYILKGSEFDYKNAPKYKVFVDQPIFPEGSATPNEYGELEIDYNKYENLAFWFKNNIPDINTINSLYDSISEKKNYFDSKIVLTNSIDYLFSGINFVNMDEINKILSKIFVIETGNVYHRVSMKYIYDGLNIFKTAEGKYKTTYPNNFKLKPKLLNGYISVNDNWEHPAIDDKSFSLFGGAFVKTLDISEFNLSPMSTRSKAYYSYPGNRIVGMFRDCIAQKIIGLDKFPFNKFHNCSSYMFANAFNLDKYIDKIEDEDTKKKLKREYYNNIGAIRNFESYIDSTDSDIEPNLDNVIFEYWVKPLKLKSIGATDLKNGSRKSINRKIRGTFENAYICSIDLTEINLQNFEYLTDMFKGTSTTFIKFKTIGSRKPNSKYMLNISNLFNVSKSGPFRLRSIEGEIIFPDKEYIIFNPDDNRETYVNGVLVNPIGADILKNILPSKEALAPGVTNIGLKFKNYDKDALLKFIQDNGRPEITTEEQLFEFFGLPKEYIIIDNTTDDGTVISHSKPADFDTNPYSDEAIDYMRYNGIHMEEPDDLETNVYGDASVAFRKLYNLPLPKPADYDTNPYSHEANVWAKFYNISRPSPPLMPT